MGIKTILLKIRYFWFLDRRHHKRKNHGIIADDFNKLHKKFTNLEGEKKREQSRLDVKKKKLEAIIAASVEESAKADITITNMKNFISVPLKVEDTEEVKEQVNE